MRTLTLTLTLTLALGLSFIAHAEDATGVLQHSSQHFAIDSMTDVGNRIYYNCDSVENQVTGLLKEMGAQNIRVTCYGGMDRNMPPISWEASVDLSYSAMKLAGADESGVKAIWTPVSIRDSDNCHLLTQVFRNVKGHFAIRSLKGPGHCGSIDQSFRVQFETLKAL
jgi:hypothetical protein